MAGAQGQLLVLWPTPVSGGGTDTRMRCLRSCVLQGLGQMGRTRKGDASGTQARGADLRRGAQRQLRSLPSLSSGASPTLLTQTGSALV